MPLYEYECEACRKRFEVIQKFSDPVLDTCRVCGKGPVRRLLSSPAIQFKGTGWYITDYAQKGKPAGDGADAGKSGAAEKPDKTGGGSSGESTAKGEAAASAAGVSGRSGNA